MMPSVPTLRRVCVALGISADEAFGFGSSGEPRIAVQPEPPKRLLIQRLIRRAANLEDRTLRVLLKVAAHMADNVQQSARPGYVDSEGYPFFGAIKLGVYGKGMKTLWFPIQDGDACTPQEKARERLEKATQELARLGIDLARTKPGTPLTAGAENRIVVSEGPGAPYTLEDEMQVKLTVNGKRVTRKKEPKTPEEAQAELERATQVHHMEGELVVFMRQGSARRKLLSEPMKGSFTPAVGETFFVRLARVWLSPSGRRLVIITERHNGGIRDIRTTQRLLGVVRWDGTPLVLR